MRRWTRWKQPPDTVFVLGMGGETICGILQRGHARLGGAALILGAQTDLPMVRRTVCEVGYRIRREVIASAGGRDYVLMRCTPARRTRRPIRSANAMLGPGSQVRGPREWRRVLERRERLLQQEISAMERAGLEKDRERLAMNRRELGYVTGQLRPWKARSGRGRCAVKVRDVLSWLDALAPFDSAEDFDNVGLLLGDEEAPVRGVTFGMDVTEALVDEALAHGDGLIVTHHPFIFHALKRINYNEPQGRTLLKLTANRCA